MVLELAFFMPGVWDKTMPSDRSDIDRRLRTWRIVMLCSMGLLIGALYYFQIIHGDSYIKLATGNRLRFVRFAPSRGNIYDRNGAPLATNIRTFDIMISSDLEKEQLVSKHLKY